MKGKSPLPTAEEPLLLATVIESSLTKLDFHRNNFLFAFFHLGDIYLNGIITTVSPSGIPRSGKKHE